MSDYINPYFFYPDRNWLVAKDTLFFLRCYLENGQKPFSASDLKEITKWLIKDVRNRTACSVVLWEDENCLLEQDWKEFFFEKMNSSWKPDQVFLSKGWKKCFDKVLKVPSQFFPKAIKTHKWLGYFDILPGEEMETLLLNLEFS